MSNLSIEKKFLKPRDEIQKIQSDLIFHFGEDFAAFINEMAIELAAEYHESISRIILKPFVKVNEDAAALPQNVSKEQYYAFLNKAFEKTNPKRIMNRINEVLNSKDVVKSYNWAIEQLEDSSSVKGFFEKAKFSKNVIISLQHHALINIAEVLDSLKAYIHNLKDHEKLMHDIKEKRSSNSAIKTGASLLGLGIGIPFLGLGLGAIMNAGDRSRISNSINNLINHLDLLSDQMFQTITNMNHALHLLFLTLLGGTAVAVNEMLKRKHCCIAEVHEDSIHYDLLNDEKNRFYKWVETNVNAMEQLGEQRRFADLILLAKTFYTEVKANPIHARILLPNNYTAIYLAHTYYFAAYQEALLEDYRNQHIDSFLTRGAELIKNLEITLLDAPFPKFASNPSIFFILFLKERHRHKEATTADSVGRKMMSRVFNRFKHGQFIYEDAIEQPSNAGFMLFLLYELEHTTTGLTEDEKSFHKDIQYIFEKEELHMLIEIDKSFGHKDEVSTYIQSLKSRRKLYNAGAFTRKSIKWLLIIVLLAVITFSVYKFATPAKDTVLGWWEYITSQFEEEAVVEWNEQVKIINDVANIRTAPDYNNGDILTVAVMDEQYTFTGNKLEDQSGEDIVWLEIIVNDEYAYVSAKLVEILSQ